MLFRVPTFRFGLHFSEAAPKWDTGANLRNKALAEPVRREVPGPDPLGGGLHAPNDGVREDSLGRTLR